jgi:short-subunit dehydrogenase
MSRQNMTNPARKQIRFKERYGPWAVVTGASSGIGREIALRLAECGLNLVLAARSRNALDQLAADVSLKYSVEAQVVVVDLSRETGVESLETATASQDIGLLVAAAGFGTSGRFLDSPLKDELEMLAVNCGSLVALTWHFGRRFAARGRGGLVLMSSIVGFQGMPFAAHYAATKAYVQTLAEGLAVELSPAGVDVLAAAPGPTHSGFATRAGMKMGTASDAADVALPILDALGRRSTVLPGFLGKLLTYSLVPLPRWARVRVMGRVMYGMIKHRLAPTPPLSAAPKPEADS